MVVGSDRVGVEFERLLNRYNGVEVPKHGYYGFDNIEVVSDSVNVIQTQKV